LPIVRLSRDKRGLDTIYLIDTSAEGGRRTGGARVLYFWTAPPGLRVGRSALDESTQRALERAHPEMAFDWPALRKAVDAALAQAAALATDVRREAWRGAGKASRAGRPGGGGRQGATQVATPAAPQAARRRDPDEPPADVGSDAGSAPEGGGGTEAAAVAPAPTPPATDDRATSEHADAVERRPRRRRRRPRRPSVDETTGSTPDPIIE
jgi:hypothetical protein